MNPILVLRGNMCLFTPDIGDLQFVFCIRAIRLRFPRFIILTLPIVVRQHCSLYPPSSPGRAEFTGTNNSVSDLSGKKLRGRAAGAQKRPCPRGRRRDRRNRELTQTVDSSRVNESFSSITPAHSLARFLVIHLLSVSAPLSSRAVILCH